MVFVLRILRMLASLAAVVRLTRRRSAQRVEATVQRENTANRYPQLGQLKVDCLCPVETSRIARRPDFRNFQGGVERVDLMSSGSRLRGNRRPAAGRP